jgi:hypothetical protein
LHENEANHTRQGVKDEIKLVENILFKFNPLRSTEEVFCPDTNKGQAHSPQP